MRRVDPNSVLAAVAAVVVLIELVTRSQARYGPECLVVAAGLAVTWSRRAELRVRSLVVLAVLLPAAIAAVHLIRHVPGDVDVESVYREQGQGLLDGAYPRSEYPPGAVLLFAAEQWIRSPRTVNPCVMALAQGGAVWAVATCRASPTARWLGALVALWPVNAFFWEFKFDALPTFFLAVGLVVALRRHWVAAGALLGTGAAVKWTPGVAFVVLAVWLLATGARRDAARHAAGFVAAFAAIVIPFLVRSPAAVWASVSRQAPRGITPEALWYLPLHALGRASQPGAVYDAAAVTHAANTFAVVVQALAMLGLVGLVAVRRPPLHHTVAIAAVAPAIFLLLNKVFSAQYLLTLVTVGCLAAALVGRTLGIAILLALAATANVLVYPIGRFWEPASAVMFAAALAAAAIVLVSAVSKPLGQRGYAPES